MAEPVAGEEGIVPRMAPEQPMVRDQWAMTRLRASPAGFRPVRPESRESDFKREPISYPNLEAKYPPQGPPTSDPTAEAGVLHGVRTAELATRIVTMIREFAPHATRALDVGAQQGEITRKLAAETGIHFEGIEPFLSLTSQEDGQIRIVKAGVEDIPYPADSFDLVTFISVYEHIAPSARRRSFSEMYRVLKSGGVLIGQFPNMYYPIESHSRLLFQAYLPARVGSKYYHRFAKVPWRHLPVDWFRVGPKQLKSDAAAAGFSGLRVFRSTYSINAVPSSMRRFYRLAEAFPLNFDFVLFKTHAMTASSRLVGR
jgi:ubiquinone/menaquinone biosynthesis C-methylase UbiE